MSRYLETGKIVTTFGIKGELKVVSDSTTNRFYKDNVLYLGKNEKHLEKVKISSSREYKGMYLVTINDLYDINLVEKYIGLTFYIDRDEQDDLKKNQYYFIDLIDLDIYYQDKLIGKVKDVLDLPKYSVLEVILQDEKKLLIPFIEHFIKDVLIDEKKIILDNFEELI